MRPTSRRPRSRQIAGLGLCTLGAGLVLSAVLTTVAPSADQPASAQAVGLTISASPVTDVLDGQAIAIRVQPPAGQRLTFGSRARICRDGPTYSTPNDLLPFGPGNCPNAGVSSSATPGGVASVDPLPDGSAAVGTLRVGTGRVEWGPATDADQFSLACDADNPCRLVLDVQTSAGRVIDGSTLVTFADSEAIAACGGAADGVLTSSGPDRFIDSWARWTRDRCEVTGTRASSNAVLTGEGAGLQAFATGGSDLAYSASGAALPTRAIANPRPSVSVPLALNAVVVGVLGGYPSEATDWPTGVPRPFSEVRLTVSELAALYGQGQFGFSPQPGDATLGRNPQLSPALTGMGGPAMAPSGADSVTYFATREFDTRAGSDWVTPVVPLDGIAGRSPRGVFDDFGSASPAFPVAISDQYSARSSLKRAVGTSSLTSAGNYPITWVLTDLATAEQLDIPVASIENSRGEFVRPTRESLEASVAGMQRGDDGTVSPGTGPDAEGAYPMTFVEHAVAPVEPLVDEACARRTDSQQLLAGWLEYLTGPGQGQLDGLQPLPADLLAVAEAARADVGTGGLPARCKAKPPTSPPPTTPPPAPGGVGNVPGGTPFGSEGFGGLPGSDLGGLGAPLPGTDVDDGSREADEASTEEAAEVAESSGPTLPALLGTGILAGSPGVTALLGLTLMGAGAGTLSSGTPVFGRKVQP